MKSIFTITMKFMNFEIVYLKNEEQDFDEVNLFLEEDEVTLNV